jgi:pentatricopeptide repeat protein
LEAQGFTPAVLAPLLSGLLRCFGLTRDFAASAAVWTTMRDLRIAPRPASAANPWLDALVSGGKHSEALAVCQSMRATGMTPDAESLAILVRACAGIGDHALALSFWGDLTGPGSGHGGSGASVAPSTAAYSALILSAANAGRRSEALHLLEKMLHTAVPVDESAFCHAMLACSLTGKPQLAFSLFEEMLHRSAVAPALVAAPGEETYFTLLTIAAEAGDRALVDEVLGQLTKQGVEPSLRISAALVEAARQLRDLPMAYEWLQDVRTRQLLGAAPATADSAPLQSAAVTSPSAVAFQLVMSVAAAVAPTRRLAARNLALVVDKERVEDGIPLTLPFAEAAVRAFVLGGQMLRAWSFLPADVRRATADVWASEQDTGAVPSATDESTYSLSPPLIAPFLRCWGLEPSATRTNARELARRLFFEHCASPAQAVGSSGVRPVVRTPEMYCSFAAACIDASDAAMAEALLEQLVVEDGVAPDAAFCESLLLAACEARDPQAVSRIAARMADLRIELSETALAMLSSALDAGARQAVRSGGRRARNNGRAARAVAGVDDDVASALGVDMNEPSEQEAISVSSAGTAVSTTGRRSGRSGRHAGGETSEEETVTEAGVADARESDRMSQRLQLLVAEESAATEKTRQDMQRLSLVHSRLRRRKEIREAQLEEADEPSAPDADGSIGSGVDAPSTDQSSTSGYDDLPAYAGELKQGAENEDAEEFTADEEGKENSKHASGRPSRWVAGDSMSESIMKPIDDMLYADEKLVRLKKTIKPQARSFREKSHTGGVAFFPSVVTEGPVPTRVRLDDGATISIPQHLRMKTEAQLAESGKALGGIAAAAEDEAERQLEDSEETSGFRLWQSIIRSGGRPRLRSSTGRVVEFRTQKEADEYAARLMRENTRDEDEEEARAAAAAALKKRRSASPTRRLAFAAEDLKSAADRRTEERDARIAAEIAERRELEKAMEGIESTKGEMVLDGEKSVYSQIMGIDDEEEAIKAAIESGMIVPSAQPTNETEKKAAVTKAYAKAMASRYGMTNSSEDDAASPATAPTHPLAAAVATTVAQPKTRKRGALFGDDDDGLPPPAARPTAAAAAVAATKATDVSDRVRRPKRAQ